MVTVLSEQINEGINIKSKVTQYLPFLSFLLSFLGLRVPPFDRVEEVPIDEDCLKIEASINNASMNRLHHEYDRHRSIISLHC